MIYDGGGVPKSRRRRTDQQAKEINIGTENVFSKKKGRGWSPRKIRRRDHVRKMAKGKRNLHD